MNTNNNTSTTSTAVKANNEWQKRELGALWKRVSAPSSSFPKGRTYLTGKIKIDELGEEKTVNIVVFSNIDKKNDKAPDFRIYLSKDSNEKTAAASKLTVPVRPILAPTKTASAPANAEDEEIL